MGATDTAHSDRFERVRRQSASFSASFKKVAGYVVEHYREVAFLPASASAASPTSLG